VSDLGLRQIKGPSALGTDPRRLWQLTWTLAVTDFRLRFFGSFLGYLWQLLRPLLLFGVLLVVFTQVVRLSEGVENFAQALLLGIVLYSFFADATGASVRSIVEREAIVRKIEFPRLAVPAASVLQAVFNLGSNLLVVIIFTLASGIEPRWSWFALPLLVAVLAVLCMGLAMLLSTLFVRYRDVEPIWDVVLQVLFYGSPIFYPVQTITGEHGELIQRLLMMNPFAAILQQSRHVIFGGTHPSAADAAGGLAWLLIPAALGVVLCLLGAQIFRRNAPRIAEDL
jgi:ABC-2 type transport system permease protein